MLTYSSWSQLHEFTFWLQGYLVTDWIFIEAVMKRVHASMITRTACVQCTLWLNLNVIIVITKAVITPNDCWVTLEVEAFRKALQKFLLFLSFSFYLWHRATNYLPAFCNKVSHSNQMLEDQPSSRNSQISNILQMALHMLVMPTVWRIKFCSLLYVLQTLQRLSSEL